VEHLAAANLTWLAAKLNSLHRPQAMDRKYGRIWVCFWVDFWTNMGVNTGMEKADSIQITPELLYSSHLSSLSVRI
jgi:hypothetical protein